MFFEQHQDKLTILQSRKSVLNITFLYCIFKKSTKT